MVPSIVAFGIVFSGLSTLHEGMVAHSIPWKAKKVRVAVAINAEISEVPLALKGKKFSAFIKKKPPIATSSKGIIFKIVVTNCNFPDATIPNVLIHVSNHIMPSPVSMATTAFVASMGKKILSAPTSETAMAALVHQIEIQ